MNTQIAGGRDSSPLSITRQISVFGILDERTAIIKSISQLRCQSAIVTQLLSPIKAILRNI